MSEALDSLASEYGNFRAVFQWSTSAEGDLELGLRLAGALYRFWLTRGHVTEARAWLEVALARTDPVAPRVRAVALNAAGILAGLQQDRGRALDHLDESLYLWEQLGDVSRQASVALNVGNVAHDSGDLDQAEQKFLQAQRLFARSGDRRGEAAALASRGSLAQERADPHRALELFEDSLRLFREVDDQWAIANTLANVGHTRLSLHDRIGALHAFSDSLRVGRELGNVLRIAESLEGVAAVMTDRQPRLAARLLAAAELMRETSGAPVPAIEQQRHAAIVSRARAGLAPTTFKASWNAGRVLSADTAIEIALGVAAVKPDAVSAEPSRADRSQLDVLSARERDIALLIAQGYSNRAIADKLVVSVKTVETHVKHIFSKLDVRNRAGVAAAVSRANAA
jgi:non-specific serine/threonine protein kinase